MEPLVNEEIQEPCNCPDPVRGSLPDEFLTHVQRGNLQKIQEWVDHNDVNAATHGGVTLLSAACVYQSQEILDILLQKQQLHLNTRHRIGAQSRFTPLCIAARKGLKDIVSALLESRMSECRLDVGAKTAEGKTAVLLAAEFNHWETVERLSPYNSIPANDNSLVSSLARLAQKFHAQPVKNKKTPRKGVSEVSKMEYINTTIPRGLVLILNYKFEKQLKERKGTEADAEKLHKVFKGMGYETEEHLDLSLNDTCNALEKFSSQERLKSVSCVVIIVMSHGDHQETFETADAKHLPTKSLQSYFTEEACPHMKGKPKIFLFQFCRGPDMSKQLTTTLSPARDAVFMTDALKNSFTDMMCIYASQKGFESYRFEGQRNDPYTGTPFIKAFCEVLDSKGDVLYLDDLIREFIRKYENTIGGQPCECVQLAFCKKFCFNPPR